MRRTNLRKGRKRMLLRLMALLLSLLTLAGALAACKTDPKDPTESQTEDTGRDTGGTDATESYYPLSGDYGGRSFSILARSEYPYEFDVNEAGSDDVANAVYARNLAVETAYKINIEVTTLFDSYQNNEMLDRLNNLYATGAADEDYDLIGGTQYRAAGLIPNGWFRNWNELNYIDLEADAWKNGLTEGMTVNEKTYGISGDLSIAFWKCMTSMLFNKNWVIDVWDENLYQVVNDGKWTYEYFKRVVLAASNNDGASPDDGDKTGVYGFGSDHDVAIDGFVAAFGLNLISKNEEGKLSLSDLASEKVINFVDEMQSFYTSENHYAWAYIGVDPSFYFRKKQIMIAPMRFEMIERMLDWEGDYGVIPYPKYDSQQEEYASPMTDGATLFMIPNTNRDTDFTCIITSALAEESVRGVIPRYYERVIKSKGARDPQSYQMLDLIRKTCTMDYSVLYCLYAKDLIRSTINSVIKPSRPAEKNYMSNYEHNLEKMQDQVKKLNEFYFGTGS